jgi:putative peptidoglycan lipid II flippase
LLISACRAPPQEAGAATDAFFVAFRIPNILRRLLAEGALSTALIPTFSDYAVNRPRTELLRMCRAVFGAALVALVAATVIGVIAAPWIVAVIAPGFDAVPGQAPLTVALTRVMFPYLVLVGVAALGMGALNAQGRFFAPALGPAALNLGMIAGTLGLAGWVEPPILALAWGVLIGGVGQVLVQVPSLGRCGLLLPPSPEWSHPAVGRAARLLLPAVFGLASVQVMVFVNTLLASLLPIVPSCWTVTGASVPVTLAAMLGGSAAFTATIWIPRPLSNIASAAILS